MASDHFDRSQRGARPTKKTSRRARITLSESIRMVMFLPFLTAFVAAILALRGKPRGAAGWSLATIAISLAWLFYHATSKLDIVL
jgi:Family of unknown function (DUF5993)